MALCRDHGVKLTVVISPMHHSIESRLDPDDMTRAVDAINRIVPLWDFSKTSSMTSLPGLWHSDRLHFSDQVSWSMLRRIFSGTMPPGWEEFGRLRQHGEE